MAFIRAHMTAGSFDDYGGDPFRFRLPKLGGLFRGAAKLVRRAVPKAVRKLSLRKIVQQLAPAAEQFAPIEDDEQMYAPPPEPETYIPPELVEYARSFGIELGGDPKPNKTVRRGTVARAQDRPNPKTKHSTRGTTSARPKRKGPTAGEVAGIFGKNLKGAAKDLPAILGKIGRGDVLGMAPWNMPHGAAGGGGRRRRINPTNVKALKRGIRRIEGFEKIVKQVQRAYPRIKHATMHAAPHHFARRRSK